MRGPNSFTTAVRYFWPLQGDSRGVTGGEGTPSLQGPPPPQVGSSSAPTPCVWGPPIPGIPGHTALTTSPWWSPFSSCSWDTRAGRPGHRRRCRGVKERTGQNSPREQPAWGDEDVTPARVTPPTPSGQGFPAAQPRECCREGYMEYAAKYQPLNCPATATMPPVSRTAGTAGMEGSHQDTGTQPPNWERTPKPGQNPSAWDAAPKTSDTSRTQHTAPPKAPRGVYGPGNSDPRDPPDSGKGTGGCTAPRIPNFGKPGR